MSIAEQVQTIRRGLFTNEFPPLDMRQILDNGTQSVVNWGRIRPAVVALGQMPWHDLDSQWQYFLEEARYPIGIPMDLRPDEVGTFQNLVQNLINMTSEPMRILMSLHPETTLNDVSVILDSSDLETLEKAIHRVRRTVEIAAIDDAITVSKVQAGSIEILLTAGTASKLALELAILLAREWRNPQTKEKARQLLRLFRRSGNGDASEDDALESVRDDAKEVFWQNATEHLESTLQDTGKSVPEAKGRIERAAAEIYENAEEVSANWKLPPAVIRGLPGGLTVSLYHDDPEAIGRVIKALVEASD